MVHVPLYGYPKGTIKGWARVDDEDAEWALGLRWNLSAQGYVVSADRSLLMHRSLCGLQKGDGLYVDHINHDRLDNRRDNLRVVTNAENMQNRAPRVYGTSRYRGVAFCNRTKRWVAQVTIGGKNHFLGRYHDEDEAGRVADEFRRSRNLVPG